MKGRLKRGILATTLVVMGGFVFSNVGKSQSRLDRGKYNLSPAPSGQDRQIEVQPGAHPGLPDRFFDDVSGSSREYSFQETYVDQNGTVWHNVYVSPEGDFFGFSAENANGERQYEYRDAHGALVEKGDCTKIQDPV